VFAFIVYLGEQHRATLANPHQPRREGKPRRFPRSLARFNYRESRPRRKAATP
jgi:hypothetical protein